MMNANTYLMQAVPADTRVMSISLWVAQIASAAILAMGAFAKFFNYTPEGSMALGEALDIGRGVITAIGVVETIALVLLLIPGKRAFGAALAVMTMSGALFSHATKIGFSGSAVAEMWPLALVVLAASAFVLIVRRRDLPLPGQRLKE